MIHVFLDDFRKCPRGFVHAKNAEECNLLIDSEAIDVLSLDFDLGWGQPTGYDVVCHLISRGRYPQQIYLHSSSVSGRQQMYHLLSTNIPITTMLHHGPMPQSLLDEIASKPASRREGIE